MKIVIQRVSKASVAVNDTIVGSIDIGMCLLVGIWLVKHSSIL